MNYTTEKNGIQIEQTADFNPTHTLNCGQLFRYFENNGNYTVLSKDRKAEIGKTDGGYFIATDDPSYFVRYFDLDRDYGAIKAKVVDNDVMARAVDFGGGIRILRQDFAEAVIEFIISANNNIPRIKGIINKMCVSLGENMGDYYAFPTLTKIASKPASFYSEMGAGYRDSYIVDTAKKLLDTDIDELLGLPTDELQRKLLSFKGVGPKVADCILLFGAGRGDVFPVDTWMEKVYADYYGELTGNKEIRRFFLNRYGEYSGYAQQYLFYYKRVLESNFKDKNV